MAKFVKANDKELETLKELIEDVTSNKSENSKALVAICDIINSSSDGPKDAVKCVRKRLATKNPSVVKMTLLLLDSCVKNCGMRFHSQIFSRDFLESFLKIIKPKNNPTMEIQTTVLGLIQKWAIAFQGIPELREICRAYEDLMNTHIEFPPRDPEQVSQLYIMSSSGNPNSLFGSQSGERRESTRSIGLLQPDCCTVYEVEPSSATLNPTGSDRRRGKSADPRFPHRNTLNPNGRSPSRDRSPAPGGMRRSSYASNLGDDIRVAGLRKQSFVVVSNESVGGQERKQSYVECGDGHLPVLIQGSQRKHSYVGASDGHLPVLIQGSQRKQSYVGVSDGHLPVLIHGKERKNSYVGSSAGQMPAVASDLGSELDSIRQNCQFFGEMLSAVKPGKEPASEKELLREYNLTCLEMKKRVVRLLDSSEGEKFSDELLNLNDELNIVLFRYQKYSRSATLTEKDRFTSSNGAAKVTHQPVMITVEDSDIGNLIDSNSAKADDGHIGGRR